MASAGLWRREAESSCVRIRLHKILNEGRSVRFEKPDEADETIDVNVIVFKETRPARQRTE